MGIKFQKMCNIIAVAGRYHIFIKITRKTVFCHILQRAFRNGFIFNTIMFHQVRQILNQALICSLRAIIYQYLMITRKCRKHIHSKRDTFNGRNTVQSRCINTCICHACKLLHFFNGYQAYIMLSLFLVSFLFRIFSFGKRFRIYPCNFVVPVINEADYISLFCTACVQTSQSSSHHLGHKRCRNSRSG